MKVFLILVAFAISTQGLRIPVTKLIEHSNDAIAKWISNLFISRLHKELLLANLVPMATLLPPSQDPGQIPTLQIPLTFNSSYIKSEGYLSWCTPHVTGLSKVTDDLTVGLVGKTSIKWDFSVPTVTFKGPYQLEQTVESGILFMEPGPHSIQGQGLLAASVNDVFFRVEATGRAAIGKLHLDTFSVDLGFKNLSGHGENTTLDGNSMPLDSLECTLAQVIGGNLTCLSLTLDPTCFSNSTPALLPWAQFEHGSKDIDYCDALTTESPTTTTSATTEPIVSTSPRPTTMGPLPTTMGPLPTTMGPLPTTTRPLPMTTTTRPLPTAVTTTTANPRPVPPIINIETDIDIDIDININYNFN